MSPISLSYVCLSQIYHLPLLIIITTKLSQSLYHQSSVLSLYQPLTKEKQMQYSAILWFLQKLTARKILQVLQSARPKLVAILDKLLDYTLLTAIVIVLLAVPSYLNTLWGRSCPSPSFIASSTAIIVVHSRTLAFRLSTNTIIRWTLKSMC